MHYIYISLANYNIVFQTGVVGGMDITLGCSLIDLILIRSKEKRLPEEVLEVNLLLLVPLSLLVNNFFTDFHNFCQFTIKLSIAMGIVPIRMYAMTLMYGYKWRSKTLLSHFPGTWPADSQIKYSVNPATTLSALPVTIPRWIIVNTPNTMKETATNIIFFSAVLNVFFFPSLLAFEDWCYINMSGRTCTLSV